MAGHSKWANIKFRKGAQDAKRGKIFTKLIREITVAARLGGDDINSNPRLRDAINKAYKANMKKDTVENAINKGLGKLDGDSYHEITYEGYGPSGVAVYVQCLTDNKNRTVAEVRHAFTKHHGNLGADGSVGYLFESVGQFVFAPPITEDELFEIAADYDALDITTNEEGYVIINVPKEKFHELEQEFAKHQLPTEHAEVTLLAQQLVKVTEHEELVIKLIDALEDLDDVQNVYSNADF